MIAVCVDPSLLALRPSIKDPRVVDAIIARVRAVRRLLEEAAGSIALTSDALIETLAAEELLPLHDSVSAKLHELGLTEFYTASDVGRLMYEVLDRAGDISDYSLFSEFILDNAALSPPDVGLEDHPRLRYALWELLGHVCLSRSHRADWIPDISAVTSPVFDGFGHLSFVGHLDMVAPPIGSPPSEKCVCHIELPVATAVDEIYCLQDPYRLWRNAEDSRSLILAITVGGLRSRKAMALPALGSELTAFRLGEYFFDSLARHDASGNGMYVSVVANACFSICAGTHDALGELFMEGPRSKSRKPRTRQDGAVAYRLHLTAKHQALRLMSWLLPSGIVEFANVGNKGEEEIR